jgi:hypothetical protein
MNNNMNLSFIELLVFSLIIIVFTISGFIISKIVNHYWNTIWGIEVTRIFDCGVFAGILVATWIFYIYYLWKNGNIEQKP